MEIKTARKYTDDFKYRAIELSKEVGAAEAERKLGIASGNIRNWKKNISITGKVSRADTKSPTETMDDEVKRLRRENSELKKANLILKSAAAFFRRTTSNKN